MNLKTLILTIALASVLLQLLSCTVDSVEKQLLNHIFELKTNPADSTQQTFFHFIDGGTTYVYYFKDFAGIEMQSGSWRLENDFLKISTDNAIETMAFKNNRQSTDSYWTTEVGNSLHPLPLKAMESTIFIPADKYGKNVPAIPFLFLESTKKVHLLMRLFSSCDYLSALIEIKADEPLQINFPSRRFEAMCPYLERSEKIKTQITESDQFKYEFPDLFFLKKGEVIGHWKAVGGIDY